VDEENMWGMWVSRNPETEGEENGEGERKRDNEEKYTNKGEYT
jgi:hypothetical protein